MLDSIKNRDDLEKLDELVSSWSHVKALILQNKLGKQNFHEETKKVIEPITKTNKEVSEDIPKTITVTSEENDNALANLKNKLLEKTNKWGKLACYLPSSLSKITNPEHTCQFKLVKDPDSNRVNDLLINKRIPVIPYDNLLTFRDTDKKLKIQGYLLKMITNKNKNADLTNLPDKTLMYDFPRKTSFDEKALGDKSTWDKSLKRLLQSPAIIALGFQQYFNQKILKNFVIE